MFHVFVRLNSSDTDRPLLLDMSKAQLQSGFVVPYLDGRDIFNKGEITRISNISKVTVLRSELTAAQTLQEMAANHQSEIDRIKREDGQNVIDSYRGRELRELVGYCKDVTGETVVRAPGSGTRKAWIMELLRNPWVVQIVAGVIVLILGVFLGKLWGSG